MHVSNESVRPIDWALVAVIRQTATYCRHAVVCIGLSWPTHRPNCSLQIRAITAVALQQSPRIKIVKVREGGRRQRRDHGEARRRQEMGILGFRLNRRPIWRGVVRWRGEERRGRWRVD